MTHLEHAASANMLKEALWCEIDAAKARRPSSPWPRKLPADARDGWAYWSEIAGGMR